MAEQAEIVALARAAGADYAAATLHVDVRTVHKYLEAAGDPPELDGTAAGWQQLLELAHSQVVSALTRGKVRPKDAAVIAAISERNLRQLEARAAPQQAEAGGTDDDLIVAIRERYPDPEEAALAIHLTTQVIRVSLHDAPPGPDVQLDPRAGEYVNEWLLGILESTVDLSAAVAAHEAWFVAERARRDVIARRADVLHRDGGMQYHAARQMADELSDDFPLPPLPEYPSLGQPIDITAVSPVVLDDDTLDAVTDEIERRRAALEKTA